MKEYKNPEYNVFKYNTDDVITTSGEFGGGSGTGGSTGGGASLDTVGSLWNVPIM